MTNGKLPPYFEKYFDQKFDEMNKRFDEMQGILDRCEMRITTLELFKSELVGKIAVISFAFVFVLNFVIDWVKKRLNI